ncbi:hypothetical protein ACKWTF_012896 [Chironomus riparius]
MEEIKEPNKSDWNVFLRFILSVLGFILSIVYLLCGLFMLVRFWLITDFYYLLYMISTILIGTLFNIFSCNLFLYTEVPTNKTIWPYFWFTPITIVWNVLGIIQPFTTPGYFKNYSHIPILTYMQAFYDADAYNSTVVYDHPFTRKYKQSSQFFNSDDAVISVLFVLLVVQIVFWIMTISAYRPILKNYIENKNVKVL